MPAPPRPPIRNCPLCGLTMLSSKSDEGNVHYDTFSCLNCKTVISLAPPPKRPKPNQ
jgi:transcription elongation factor Elf1